MLLHSGRTYPPDYLDLEAKLDLILKELQDLKLRVDRLKSKSNERTLDNRKIRRENYNDRRRGESTNRPRINKNNIICRIKMDPLTFDGILNSKIFND